MLHFRITSFLSTLFLFTCLPSIGCICWNESFPSTYLTRNDTLPSNQQYYIVKGIVIDLDIGDNVYNRWGHGNLVNVKVLMYWPKDAIIGDTLTILNDELDCRSSFLMDSTYLIGAKNTSRYVATSQCEGTGLFSKYKELVQKLGQPGVPKTIVSSTNLTLLEQKHKVKQPILLIVLLVISLILNVILVIKRKIKSA